MAPDYVALLPEQADRSGEDIMAAAHAAAGGPQWVRPDSLSMDEYAVYYRDGVAVRNERHTTYRVYALEKADAHRADGKVQIIPVQDGKPVIDIAFDGEMTYMAKGPQPQSDADARWTLNFGFGARHC